MLGTIFFLDAIPAAFLAYMLAQQQSVLGIENAHVKLIPLHIHFSSDPARWQAVVGGIDCQLRDALNSLAVLKGML